MLDTVSRQQLVMPFCELCEELGVCFVGEVGVVELIDPQLKDLLIFFYFLGKSVFKCRVDRCYFLFEQVDGKTVVFGLVNEGLELLKIEGDMVDRLKTVYISTDDAAISGPGSLRRSRVHYLMRIDNKFKGEFLGWKVYISDIISAIRGCFHIF